MRGSDDTRGHVGLDRPYVSGATRMAGKAMAPVGVGMVWKEEEQAVVGDGWKRAGVGRRG